MGLNLFSKAGKGAMSGASAGATTGPWGALAGGVIGGLAGAFGPSSAGGITGQGGEMGEGARDYYDQAFPGTNAWERLGAGNPMGAMGAASVSSKAQTQNTKRTMATSVANVAAQTLAQRDTTKLTADAHVKAAAMTARASAYATGAGYDPADQAAGMRAVVDGPGSPGYAAPTSISAARTTAAAHSTTAQAATLDSWSRDKMVHMKSRELDIMAGHHFKDPATARMAALAAKAHDIGMEQSTFLAWIRDNPKKLLAMGVAVRAGGALTEILGQIFGRLKVSNNPGRRAGIPKTTSVAPVSTSTKIRIHPRGKSASQWPDSKGPKMSTKITPQRSPPRSTTRYEYIP